MIDNIDFVELEAEEYWTPSNKKENVRELAKNFIF
jgi:hypothetical protein